MENLESGTDGSSYHVEVTREPLISGLPDDVALFCMARVPRQYHTVLKCVSRRWRDLVCSEEWYAYRKRENLAETWIYALCRDKFERVCCYVLDPNASRKCWRRIRWLPPRCLLRKGMGFQVLGKKLYLLGGCRWSEDGSDESYCYDVAMDAWTETSSLSSKRCYFACEVLNEKLYVIGGCGPDSAVHQSVDVYDPCTNSWKSSSDRDRIPELEGSRSVVLDGKIYIRCDKSSVTSKPRVDVFEPSSGIWGHADANMASGWQGPAVVVNETLYVLDESSAGTRLMMWQKGTLEWVPVGRLSPLLVKPPCKVVAIGSNIFVINNGGATVVIDVSNAAGNMGGVLVSSSLPLHSTLAPHDYVLSCRCLAI